MSLASACLRLYYEHSAEVDDLISAHLRNWTMERLPRVSLTVLRLGLAADLYGDEKKPGVVINEAVGAEPKLHGSRRGCCSSSTLCSGSAATRRSGLDAEPAQLCAAIRWASTPAIMQPLWLSLIQPERLFAQKSVSFR